MADRPQQNVYVVNAPEEWPEKGDPFIIYHETYSQQTSVLYYWDEQRQEYRALASELWVANNVGLDAIWLWEDSGVSNVDPGSERISANSISLTNITEFAISEQTATGIQIGDNIGIVQTGDVLLMFDNDRNDIGLFNVTAPVTDNGTWFQIPVLYIRGNAGNPQQDDIMEMRWYPQL